MAFQPATFLQTAKRLAKGAHESDFRTAVGRSYYAAYGHVTDSMSQAHRIKRATLFGKTGHHYALAKQMSYTPPFKLIASAYNGLLVGRSDADYTYDSHSCTKADAQAAVSSAEYVLRKLRAFDAADFTKLRGP